MFGAIKRGREMKFDVGHCDGEDIQRAARVLALHQN
jgi:hypothetical protein